MAAAARGCGSSRRARCARDPQLSVCLDRRRLCGLESAMYHCSNVASAIVRTLGSNEITTNNCNHLQNPRTTACSPRPWLEPAARAAVALTVPCARLWQALSHVVAPAASVVARYLLLSASFGDRRWLYLRFVRAPFRDASEDVPISHTTLVRRRLCGRESANHHSSNVASAIVRTLN